MVENEDWVSKALAEAQAGNATVTETSSAMIAVLLRKAFRERHHTQSELDSLAEALLALEAAPQGEGQ